MMSSTTAVGVNWIRIVAANLARTTSTVAVILFLLILSEPIGYGWGIGFSAFFGTGMIVIWVVGDPVVFHALRDWSGRMTTTWCSSCWDSMKQRVNARWDSMKQRVNARWDTIKQNVSARCDRIKQWLNAAPREHDHDFPCKPDFPFKGRAEAR
jgi:hypothetical protein